MSEKQDIVWLEDPKQWKYLRVSPTTRGSRRGFRKGGKLPLADFYKLVGYQLQGRLDRGCFLYKIFWLKTYDSGCPLGHEVYDKNGGKPCEAVDVEKLLSKYREAFKHATC